MTDPEEKTLEELFGAPRGLMEEDVLTKAQFADLPTYSCTLPSGTTIGKKWKRDVNEPRRFQGDLSAKPEWWTGEYVPHENPELVGILWRRVVIRG
jgi:hypothetical protein